MSTVKEMKERFRKGLRKRGMREPDIRIALEICALISVFDQIIFSSDDPCRVEFNVGKKRQGSKNKVETWASYTPRKKGREERYTINVAGLERIYRSKCRKRFLKIAGKKVSVLQKDGKNCREAVSRDVWAATVAAHEVRHRIQFRRPDAVRMFTSRTWRKVRDPLLENISRFVHYWFKYQRRDMRKDGASEEIIAKMTNRLEFDAAVIETLVAQCPSSLKSEKSIRLMLLRSVYSSVV